MARSSCEDLQGMVVQVATDEQLASCVHCYRGPALHNVADSQGVITDFMGLQVTYHNLQHRLCS